MSDRLDFIDKIYDDFGERNLVFEDGLATTFLFISESASP